MSAYKVSPGALRVRETRPSLASLSDLSRAESPLHISVAELSGAHRVMHV